MSRFTTYQVHHYRKIFDRYVDTEDGKLTVTALYHLLLLFGPEMSIEDVKQLVYDYDYNCKGALEFEDFLELLSDYETRVAEEKNAIKDAFQLFIKKAKESGLGRDAFIQILKAGDTGFTDAEIDQVIADYFPTGAELITDQEFVERDTTTRWVPEAAPNEMVKKLVKYQGKPKGDNNVVIDIDEEDDQDMDREENKESLSRIISVQIHRATNLEPFCRTKIRRGKGVQYNTIDPIISVTCAGETKETKALIGDSQPEWQEELRFEVEFPKVGSLFELSHWISTQRLQFNLYDYLTEGAVPHLEWIASGSVSLASALEATGSQRHIILTLRSPALPPPGFTAEDCAVHLEISLRVDEDGIIEMFQHPEDDFVTIYQKKLMVDLSCGLQAKQAAFRRKLSNVFRSMTGLNELKDEKGGPESPKAPQTHPNFIGKDRSDSRSGPLSPASLSVSGASGASASSSNLKSSPTPLWKHYITFYEDFRKKFKRRPFPVLGIDEYNVFRCFVTFIRPFEVPSDLRSAKRIAERVASFPYHRQVPSIPPQQTILQCSSPALYPMKDSLSELEGAVLQCNLFLGIGLDAYVCVGSAREQRRYWVVVLERHDPNPEAHAHHPAQAPTHPKSNTLALPTKLDLPATPVLRSTNIGSGIDNEFQAIQSKSDFEVNTRPNTARDVEWESSQFSRLQEKMRKIGIRALHWNSTTGHVWSHDTRGCPFERIDSIFNHKNVWINTQRSTLLNRCHWDLNDTADWSPFLSPQVVEECGPIECWYSERSLGQYTYLQGMIHDITPKSLVGELIQYIQSYRRNCLYIPETFFHRRISRYLQESIHKCEDFDQNGISPYQKATEEGLVELLPDHIGWYGRIWRLSYRNMDKLLQQLAWIGILDCTVPNTVYAIAAHLQRHNFGTATIWVHVGYLFNLHDPRNI